MNLREKYIASKGINTATAEVPEWGSVFLRSLTLAEMDRLEACIKANPAEALAVAVVLGVSDEHGSRVFTDTDLGAIKATSFAVVKAVAEAVIGHNKLNAEVVADEKKD